MCNSCNQMLQTFKHFLLLLDLHLNCQSNFHLIRNTGHLEWVKLSDLKATFNLNIKYLCQ